MIKVASHLRSIVDHDGAVILDIPANRMTTLNASGAYIWSRLLEGNSVEEVIAQFANETGQDSLIVEHDVREFFEHLKQRRLFSD